MRILHPLQHQQQRFAAVGERRLDQRAQTGLVQFRLAVQLCDDALVRRALRHVIQPMTARALHRDAGTLRQLPEFGEARIPAALVQVDAAHALRHRAQQALHRMDTRAVLRCGHLTLP